MVVLQEHFKFLIDFKLHFAKEHEFPIDLSREPTRCPHGFQLGKNPRNKLYPCGSGKKYKKCHGA